MTVNRAGLLERLSGFVAACRGNDVAACLAHQARLTLNGAVVDADAFALPGAPTPYRLVFADEARREVGCHATFNESGAVGIHSLRLKIDSGGEVSEVEAMIARKGDSNAFAPHRLLAPNPVFERLEPNARRQTRDDLIAIADAYFDAIEISNGEGAPIAPACDRIENGLRTTNNPAAGLPWDCRDGMKIFSYIDRVRDRRYPLVDVARGVVLSIAALEVPANSTLSLLVDGKSVERPQAERSIFLSELFKVSNGEIEAVDVVVRNAAKGAAFGWPVRGTE